MVTRKSDNQLDENAKSRWLAPWSLLGPSFSKCGLFISRTAAILPYLSSWCCVYSRRLKMGRRTRAQYASSIFFGTCRMQKFEVYLFSFSVFFVLVYTFYDYFSAALFNDPCRRDVCDVLLSNTEQEEESAGQTIWPFRAGESHSI